MNSHQDDQNEMSLKNLNDNPFPKANNPNFVSESVNKDDTEYTQKKIQDLKEKIEPSKDLTGEFNRSLNYTANQDFRVPNQSALMSESYFQNSGQKYFASSICSHTPTRVPSGLGSSIRVLTSSPEGHRPGFPQSGHSTGDLRSQNKRLPKSTLSRSLSANLHSHLSSRLGLGLSQTSVPGRYANSPHIQGILDKIAHRRQHSNESEQNLSLQNSLYADRSHLANNLESSFIAEQPEALHFDFDQYKHFLAEEEKKNCALEKEFNALVEDFEKYDDKKILSNDAALLELENRKSELMHLEAESDELEAERNRLNTELKSLKSEELKLDEEYADIIKQTEMAQIKISEASVLLKQQDKVKLAYGIQEDEVTALEVSKRSLASEIANLEIPKALPAHLKSLRRNQRPKSITEWTFESEATLPKTPTKNSPSPRTEDDFINGQVEQDGENMIVNDFEFAQNTASAAAEETKVTEASESKEFMVDDASQDVYASETPKEAFPSLEDNLTQISVIPDNATEKVTSDIFNTTEGVKTDSLFHDLENSKAPSELWLLTEVEDSVLPQKESIVDNDQESNVLDGLDESCPCEPMYDDVPTEESNTTAELHKPELSVAPEVTSPSESMLHDVTKEESNLIAEPHGIDVLDAPEETCPEIGVHVEQAVHKPAIDAEPQREKGLEVVKQSSPSVEIKEAESTENHSSVEGFATEVLSEPDVTDPLIEASDVLGSEEVDAATEVQVDDIPEPVEKALSLNQTDSQVKKTLIVEEQNITGLDVVEDSLPSAEFFDSEATEEFKFYPKFENVNISEAIEGVSLAPKLSASQILEASDICPEESKGLLKEAAIFESGKVSEVIEDVSLALEARASQILEVGNINSDKLKVSIEDPIVVGSDKLSEEIAGASLSPEVRTSQILEFDDFFSEEQQVSIEDPTAENQLGDTSVDNGNSLSRGYIEEYPCILGLDTEGDKDKDYAGEDYAGNIPCAFSEFMQAVPIIGCFDENGLVEETVSEPTKQPYKEAAVLIKERNQRAYGLRPMDPVALSRMQAQPIELEFQFDIAWVAQPHLVIQFLFNLVGVLYSIAWSIFANLVGPVLATAFLLVCTFSCSLLLVDNLLYAYYTPQTYFDLNIFLWFCRFYANYFRQLVTLILIGHARMMSAIGESILQFLASPFVYLSKLALNTIELA